MKRSLKSISEADCGPSNKNSKIPQKTASLPKDLVFEILSWLPSDSLMRFKCVEKSWRSLIKSPEFVAAHLRNHVRTSNPSFLIQRTEYTNFDDYKSILTMVTYNSRSSKTGDGGDSFVAKDVILPSKFRGAGISIAMTGHPNGILCFLIDQKIVIANLEIGEFITDIAPTCISYDYECSVQINGVGCRFDVGTKEFKVVRMLEDFYVECEYSPRSELPRAEIYTSSSKSWKEIDFVGSVTTFKFVEQLSIAFYWNGACYWPAKTHSGSEGILSFDFDSEVFNFVALPDYFTWFNIIEYEGTLALICHQSNSEDKQFDILALDDFLDGKPLTKLTSFKIHEKVETPLVFLNSNEILLRQDYSRQVISYHIITKQRTEVPVSIDKVDFSLQVVGYKGSLMSIKEEKKNSVTEDIVQHDSDRCLLVRRISDSYTKSGDLRSWLSMVTYNKDSLIVKNVDLPSEFDQCRMRIVTTAQHGGILCLLADGDVVIANLETSEFKTLPDSSLSYSYDRAVLTSAVGCDFDARSKDFKVVRILENFHPACCPRAEVYTSRSKTWREVRYVGSVTRFRFRDDDQQQIAFYWKGACYWPAKTYSNDEGILSFHMDSEVFNFVSLPYYFFWFNIVEYNGTLALISQSYAEEKRFSIWALDEFLDGGSLKKLLSIRTHENVEKPLVFLDDEELLLSSSKRRMESYNILSKQSKVLPFDVEDDLFLQVVSLRRCFVSSKRKRHGRRS